MRRDDVDRFHGDRAVHRTARAIFVVAMLLVAAAIALAASADFLDNFKNFVLLLLMVFTPWSAINLTDYYLVSRERVDLPGALRPGRPATGRWNVVALTTYVIGVVVQVPFLAQSLYTGPVTEKLGARTSRGSSASSCRPWSTASGRRDTRRARRWCAGTRVGRRARSVRAQSRETATE